MQHTTKRRMAGLAGCLSASALVLGMIAAQEASAGIANTRHNLGSSNRLSSGVTSPLAGQYVRSGTGYSSSSVANGGLSYVATEGDVRTNATDEVCVFCHTPHGGEQAIAPLWNKGMKGAGQYTVYTSGTMQGTSQLNNGFHMSLACLACHDGTQAMDNMINAPGSNGYNFGGARIGTASSGATGANDFNSPVTTQGLSNATVGDSYYGQMNGKTGDQSGVDLSQYGVGIFMLGTDLRNDHPVGIPYCGGASGTTCNDLDFWTPQGTSGLVAPGFYVGTPAPLSRNNIRLYPMPATDLNNLTATGAYATTVECGSCHDPHNENVATFLRKSNAGSALCSTCHTK